MPVREQPPLQLHNSSPSSTATNYGYSTRDGSKQNSFKQANSNHETRKEFNNATRGSSWKEYKY